MERKPLKVYPAEPNPEIVSAPFLFKFYLEEKELEVQPGEPNPKKGVEGNRAENCSSMVIHSKSRWA
jgi:hypothetical protein